VKGNNVVKRTEFYVIVQKIDTKFIYKAGFKHRPDAELYINEFGGVIETIDCTFYKDFDEAFAHHATIQKSQASIQSFLEMTQDEQLIFKHKYPDTIEQLKTLLK